MPRQSGEFQSVRTVGGLLPQDFLNKLISRQADLEGMKPASYGLYRGEEFNEAFTRSWMRLRGAWERLTKRIEESPDEPSTGITRDMWLRPLFQELGYHDLKVTGGLTLDEKHYPISHISGSVPVHLLGYDIDLDTRTSRRAGAATQSPHSLVQEYLNRSDDHLWGFVTNGYTLRLLRDNISLTRQAFVEFDLQGMMEGEAYPDFSLLWLLCHATRLRADRPDQCILEKWTRQVELEGTRALEHLRKGVENAIRHLGQGFLNPANRDLIESLRSSEKDSLDNQDYYRQLLRMVYRLIFLFAAEDRDLLHTEETPEQARKTYAEHYSTSRLRTIAELKRGTRHPDLWRQLRLVLRKLGEPDGCPELGLPALGGFLWSDEAMPDLEPCDISNEHLLKAVRDLSQTKQDKLTRRIDYRNLGSEELGSIYESLLELRPVINTNTASFELEVIPGHERKQTGSYYTPTSLINQLLDTALEPVMDRAIRESGDMHSAAHHQFPDDPPAAKALLALRICDPASGSGHFLVAAAHRMARRLAAVRTGEEEPAPEHHRRALRDVISRCIYGVDINPMAVELCRISLWMEALQPGRPLSFLDHHVKCGNSLLGTTPEMIEKGIPDDAFKPITGDDKKVASALRKQNKLERKGQLSLDFGADQRLEEDYTHLTRAIAEVESSDNDTLLQVAEQASTYKSITESAHYAHARLVADAWCAAFAWHKKQDAGTPVTQASLDRIKAGRVDEDQAARIRQYARDYRFFHWHVEYPEVFLSKEDPGFDVVLGNPPWERVKLQEKEFFAARDEAIANAPNKSERYKLIKRLQENPEGRTLFGLFEVEKRKSEMTSAFLRNSGRYPLCGRGDINTYTVFAELNRTTICGTGRVGCIVPSGIATDDTTKYFFQNLVEKQSLVNLFDFENRKKIFEGIDSRIKFCLLTLSGTGVPVPEAEFVFFALEMDELLDPEKRFTLSSEDIELLNPNTRTCPIFRTKRDAEITKGIYRRVPVLINENDPENGNPWGIRFMRMFDMSNDSHLFRSRDDLESDGWTLEGNIFTRGSDKYRPLYEAKMIHHFNHRFGDYADLPPGSKSTQLPDIPTERLQDPSYAPLPRYWVPEEEVEERLRKVGWNHKWLLGWRDICRSTDERTAIASCWPRYGAGDTFLQMLPQVEPKLVLCLLGTLCSFAYDYSVRQKIGGTHLKYHYFKQMPVPLPEVFSSVCPWESGSILGDWIAERVLQLVYTSWDMKRLAEDCGFEGPPFPWDEERRFQLRCELDAAFFYLYGIPQEDIPYIMDTFPIARRNNEQEFGAYRTLDGILEFVGSVRKEASSEGQWRCAVPASVSADSVDRPHDKSACAWITRFGDTVMHNGTQAISESDLTSFGLSEQTNGTWAGSYVYPDGTAASIVMGSMSDGTLFPLAACARVDIGTTDVVRIDWDERKKRPRDQAPHVHVQGSRNHKYSESWPEVKQWIRYEKGEEEGAV